MIHHGGANGFGRLKLQFAHKTQERDFSERRGGHLKKTDWQGNARQSDESNCEPTNRIASQLMNTDELRALQAPIKERYKQAPEAAVVTLKAEGRLGEGVTCKVQTGKALVSAGLHPATGGDGLSACSGDMLLEALAACAGVTLGAVATAIGIELRSGIVRVEGDLDFRGTLGVAKEAPVGFMRIRLSFDLDSDATEEQLDTLVRLTERYCVVYQSLRQPPEIVVSRGKI
jgi:uncharacterized OsmC-like protein